YGAWKQKPAGHVPQFPDVNADAAKQIVGTALGRGGGWLTTDEALGLMTAVGIATASARLVSTADEACAAADTVGYPVAVKAIGPSLLHKTERQAVRLNLPNQQAVRAAAEDLRRTLTADMSGLLVQRMVPGGVEMLVGALQDATFGPL